MSSPIPTRSRSSALLVTLVWTMAASTIQLYAIAVLASEIIDDLDISRTQIGLLGAANTGVASALSPVVGRLTDVIGARRAATIVMAGAGVGLIATAAAPTFALMLVASVLAGVFQAGGNPSTNKLISLHTPPGERGTVTGIKQSGVQLALFLCGLSLPGLAVAFGWRTAVASYGVVTMVLAAILARTLPADPDDTLGSTPRVERWPIPGWVYRIAVYGFLLGVATSGVLRFLPLFAEEELGYSTTAAGLTAAVVGICGVVARVIWARKAEHAMPIRTALSVIAALTGVVAVLLTLADPIGRWLIWPTAVLVAASAVSWNPVGMLAVIRGVRSADAGRASGVVLLGFLGGLTVGAPVVGRIVDTTGSYPAAWMLVLVAAVAGLITVLTGPEPPADPEAS